jgi:hypothetical protein
MRVGDSKSITPVSSNPTDDSTYTESEKKAAQARVQAIQKAITEEHASEGSLIGRMRLFTSGSVNQAQENKTQRILDRSKEIENENENGDSCIVS